MTSRTLAVSIVMAAALCGQTIRIESGVAADQVVPRRSDDCADLGFAGSASGATGRTVEARLIRRGIPDRDWRPIAKVENGKWSGKLANVPAGGPYRAEIRIAGERAVDQVDGILVGDLWLLAGQSDMEGRGHLSQATQPHPLVHSFDMRDHWVIAEDPLHTRVDAADRAYWFLNEKDVPEPMTGEKLGEYLRWRDRGAGLGLPFAIEMVRRTGIPVGVVPCAIGGTSMDQWSPALKDKGSDSLYGAMLRRARAAGGKFKGVLWSQGAGDAFAERSPAFTAKFERFVSSLREDLGQPDLPFYFVQIGRLVADDTSGDQWNLIQEAQRRAELSIPRAGMVATADESLTDLAHADAASLKRLGIRLANLACRDQFPQVQSCANIQRGPRPVSAVYVEAPFVSHYHYREKAVRVTFTSVNGRLRADDKLSGFSIHKGRGAPLPIVYAIDVDPADGNSILVRVTEKPAAGAVLHYGYGLDPYCNVVDEANMPVPVFGPMEIR